MSESATSAVTVPLARWVDELSLDAIPERVIERAKHLLLDGVACGLVGAQLPWSRIATDAVLGMEGSGDSVVIGTGLATSGPAAVLLNSTFIQGFELDDFHPIAPLHSNSLIVPVMLATAGDVGGVDGVAALTAAIAGFEVGPRVGLALHGSQMLSRGWHSGPVFGTHTAAVVSGKLRGLDTDRIEDALGMAGTQSAGLMAAQYEAMSKRMQHGFAARNGYYAAGLAAGGYTGIKRVFDRPYGGYLAVFGEGHDPDPTQVIAGLGEGWHTEMVMVKSYAAQGGLHGTIQAALELRAEYDIDAKTISHIEIRVGHTVYHHGWWVPERPLTAIGAQMNLGYAAAVALLDGQVLPPQFSENRLDADDVWDLLDKVEVELDEQIENAPLEERFATIVTITLDDGTTMQKRITQPHGGPSDPVTNDELIGKYRSLVGPLITTARLDAIQKMVLHIDELADIGTLADALARPVAGALDGSNR
ncbi:MmgE/PrpD family protein [Antrihabitans stalactiti]|uniref:MmgE/PrpD family protein n=1 Tax=Antrihabitans stalactiti TaxID=2584121 RepID=A0A848KRX4_9NOCA|nr:MmgE/PrpD family protein [Antrihabitans stalactiti]NMN99030.1 MmgE/PrpD family protein [Antrihabitans stalactiti]